jgi:hypothetical protein
LADLTLTATVEGSEMARKYVSNKDESVRIFRSGFLEWFTYVHPIVPHLIFIPVTVFALYLGYAAGVARGRSSVRWSRARRRCPS